MKRLSLLIAVFLALFLVAPALAKDVNVTMTAQNNSGQDGTVTLSEMGNQTKVTIDIAPGAAGVQQPAHIHAGTCANLDPAPAHPLSPVVDGKSETVLDVTLATLQESPMAVNVHKSPEEASVYVSCGDIETVAAADGMAAEGTPTEAADAAEATPTEEAEATPTEAAEATVTEEAEATPTEEAQAAPTATAEAGAAATEDTGKADTLPKTGDPSLALLALSGLALLGAGAFSRLKNRS